MTEEKTKKVIGRAEIVKFSELNDRKAHARIDSGARTSSIWGSARVEGKELVVSFFGEPQEYRFKNFEKRIVASSNGQVEKRFATKLTVILRGRKIKATFTIADRQMQVYGVLIGRNVLRGKFIVDVKLGKILSEAEKARTARLKSFVEKEKTL